MRGARVGHTGIRQRKDWAGFKLLVLALAMGTLLAGCSSTSGSRATTRPAPSNNNATTNTRRRITQKCTAIESHFAAVRCDARDRFEDFETGGVVAVVVGEEDAHQAAGSSFVMPPI